MRSETISDDIFLLKIRNLEFTKTNLEDCVTIDYITSFLETQVLHFDIILLIFKKQDRKRKS